MCGRAHPCAAISSSEIEIIRCRHSDSDKRAALLKKPSRHVQKKGQNSQEISKTFTLGDRNLITCRKVRTHAGFIPSSVHRNIKTLPVFCIPPKQHETRARRRMGPSGCGRSMATAGAGRNGAALKIPKPGVAEGFPSPLQAKGTELLGRWGKGTTSSAQPGSSLLCNDCSKENEERN